MTSLYGKENDCEPHISHQLIQINDNNENESSESNIT